MWACCVCVSGHTHTCTHNLGFPDSFDDEEVEEVEEEEEEKRVKVSWKAWHLPVCWQGRQHSKSNLHSILYLEEWRVLPTLSTQVIAMPWILLIALAGQSL